MESIKLGRDGERVVAEHLQQLVGAGWRVFHDIQGDGFNIDHVVIGAGGISAVETKTRSKPVGRNEDPWVLEPKALVGCLKKQYTRLSDEQVAMASHHLERMIKAAERR